MTGLFRGHEARYHSYAWTTQVICCDTHSTLWDLRTRVQLRLVVLYRTMRLRFGYWFKSCDASGPRNAQKTNTAKERPCFFAHFSLLVVRNESCLKEGNFLLRFMWQRKAAISCAQGALLRQTLSWWHFLRCGIASEALRQNMPLSESDYDWQARVCA